jgi:hypothetical protein
MSWSAARQMPSATKPNQSNFSEASRAVSLKKIAIALTAAMPKGRLT